MEIEATERAFLEVNLGVLKDNFQTITGLLPPGVASLCVVKADAYGHGAVEVARCLESAGTRYLGVATLNEGKELRQKGITMPVLILGGIMPWDSVESFAEFDLAQTIISFEELERIRRYDGAKPLKGHLKFDTGMGRLGFFPDQLSELLVRLKKVVRLEIEGVMSHFSRSERRDAYGLGQIKAFTDILDALRRNGIQPKYAHMANSGAVCNYPEGYFDMVRPGIMLYGSYPDEGLKERLVLKPVMTWKTKIAVIRSFAAHIPLSYGGTFVTKRPTRVAYIPVGYGDGFPRALSNKGSILIRGIRCPLVGRVCMDWSMVDVTDLGDVGPGEAAVLMGDAPGAMTADEIAGHASTIPYEILCSISKRLPRVYV